MTTTSEGYAHGVYQSLANEGIELFLRRETVFDIDDCRWSIPHSPSMESLSSSVYAIVRRVVSQFVESTQTGVSRTVASLVADPMGEEGGGAGCTPSQILAIRASGPSFESSAPTRLYEGFSYSFSDVASYIAVKLESEMEGVKETVRDMEPYARQIFNEQPNRLFVRSLVITEKHARLLHFDRAGVETTPLIDIHQHPATLVRLVAGLASTDEWTLGLDDSIRWTIVNGKKDKGTLTTTGLRGDTITFPILEHIPIARECIAGRGTNCWRVQDPDTLEELVVKDSWRPDYLPPEHGLLELVHGLPGVVQMVSYEAGRGETMDFRCPSNAGKCHNRVATRTTMKSYGKSIDFFTSVLQVLCAIRDAIAGHQRLLSDGLKILHRDISHNNILIGAEGASEGYRGILIDLDMAFRATDEQPTVSANFNVGTRIFQSLSVLDSYEVYSLPMAHDYLDDLESFFYVLVYTFLIHMPNGSHVPSKEEGPSIVGPWDHPNAGIARENKSSILGGRDGLIAAEVVKRNWGPVCASLFTEFRYWMSDTRQDKLQLLFQHGEGEFDYDDDYDDDEGEGEAVNLAKKDRETMRNSLATLHALRDEHYTHVLGIFDEAIHAIEATTPNTVPSGVTNKTEIPVVEAPVSTTTKTDHGAPPDDTTESPTIVANARSVPPPVPPCAAATYPRRSSRIEALRHKTGETPLSSTPIHPQLPKPTPHAPPAPLPGVRRSARVLKRRLAETDPAEAPPSKSRRLKKGMRAARVR